MGSEQLLLQAACTQLRAVCSRNSNALQVQVAPIGSWYVLAARADGICSMAGCGWSQAHLLTAQSIDWCQLSLDKGCLRDWILAIAQQHLFDGRALIDLSCFCYDWVQEKIMGQRATQVWGCIQKGWQVHKVTRALMLHSICRAETARSCASKLGTQAASPLSAAASSESKTTSARLGLPSSASTMQLRIKTRSGRELVPGGLQVDATVCFQDRQLSSGCASVPLDTAACTYTHMNQLSVLHAGHSARPAEGCAPPPQ